MKPLTLSLAGAYHPTGKPLEQRLLSVEIELPLSFLMGETRATARVSAESLVRNGTAEGIVRVSDAPSEVSAELTFSGDDGKHYVLSIDSAFSRRGIRALTELEGTITKVPGELLGPIRLRLDWRNALFGGA